MAGKTQWSDGQEDALRERMDRAAERILERVLLRRNWTIEARDGLSAALLAVVETETRNIINGGPKK